ncbi:MAG: ankyrin repeat domain-containing protein [Alphaproteobacteria bacterium]
MTGNAWAQTKNLNDFINSPASDNKEPTEYRIEHQTNLDAFDRSIELSQEQALWAALAFEDTSKVRLLLKRGANPNRPDELSKMTPLMAAETTPIAAALLQYGANPKARDRVGLGVLHHAVSMREGAAIVKLLVDQGVNVDVRTDDAAKATPLFIALKKYIEGSDKETTEGVIRTLAGLGADLNAFDGRGETPVAFAAFNNQPELLRLLIGLGADPTKKLGNGQTPLDYARAANSTDAMRVLAELPVKSQPTN